MQLRQLGAFANVAWRMWRGKLTFISFNVTNRCTERCPMCVVWRENVEELDLVEIERIFRQLRKAGLAVIEISGGEPFLRSDLFEILHIFDSLGFLYSINTNATLLTPAHIERLAECRGLLQLSISLDSIDRERYALLRGADLLPRVMESLDAITAASVAIPVKLMVVMSRVNYDEVFRIIDFGAERGMGVSVLPVIQGPGLQHRSECDIFDASEDDRRRMSEVFLELAKRRRAGDPLWEYSGFYEIAARYVLGERIPACDAGRIFLDLRTNGDLAPCVDLPKVASLREVGVAQALDSVRRSRSLIEACSSETPCCYTCTANVSETARHPLRFSLEGLRIRRKGARVLPWSGK